MALLAKVREEMATYAPEAAKIKGFQGGFQGVRLTRRGRALSRLAVIFSTLVLIASGYSALAGESSSEAGSKEHLEVIVVAPGESLWSIAQLLGGNQEENVARIIELNALDKPGVAAGTRLIIPTRG
jgi:hypothetical protein